MKQLNVITGAVTLLLVSMQVQAGDIISSVSNAVTQFKVVNSAEARASMTARKDLAAGAIPVGFNLGSFTGVVTAGTIALRVTRSVNPAPTAGAGPISGQASNSGNATKKLNFYLALNGGLTGETIDSWYVLPQGVVNAAGLIYASSAQVLLPGKYPVSFDLAAYAF